LVTIEYRVDLVVTPGDRNRADTTGKAPAERAPCTDAPELEKGDHQASRIQFSTIAGAFWRFCRGIQ